MGGCEFWMNVCGVQIHTSHAWIAVSENGFCHRCAAMHARHEGLYMGQVETLEPGS